MDEFLGTSKEDLDRITLKKNLAMNFYAEKIYELGKKIFGVGVALYSVFYIFSLQVFNLTYSFWIFVMFVGLLIKDIGLDQMRKTNQLCSCNQQNEVKNVEGLVKGFMDGLNSEDKI